MEARSLDDLIEYAAAILRNERAFEPVVIVGDSLEFSTHIEGESWGKRVDARLAKYILSMQETLDDLLAEYPPESYPEKPPRVRVEVKEGSSIPWTDVIDFFKVMVTPMTDVHTFIAVMTALGGAAGYFYLSRFLAYKERTTTSNNETVQLEAHEKTKLEIIKALQANAENHPDKFVQYERPPRTLVSMLETDDTVEFSEGIVMEKEQARRSAPKRQPRTEAQTTYADGDYILNDQSYSLGELILIVEQDGIDVRAYTTDLSPEDALALYQDIAKRSTEETLPLTIKIQVNVKHTARMIKFASIVGTGDPRPDKEHKRLSELLNR